jgi:hypothetical protein
VVCAVCVPVPKMLLWRALAPPRARCGAALVACSGVLFLTRPQVRIELLSQRKTALVAAHDTQLAALALAHDGSKLATASQKGTIVRIFDCATALPLRELRRGSTSASVYCLSFNSMGNRICCSSDTSAFALCVMSSFRCYSISCAFVDSCAPQAPFTFSRSTMGATLLHLLLLAQPQSQIQPLKWGY